MQQRSSRSFLGRLGYLGILLGVTWLVVFVLGPALEVRLSPLRQMASLVDKMGIETGEFYYTDVEACTRADMETSDTIRYFIKKKRLHAFAQ